MDNHGKAERYFIDLGIMPEKEDRTERWCLHHIDWTLKENDPERYEQWNIEDLLPMTVRQHRRLHMLIDKINNDTKKYGKTRTEEEKKYLSELWKGRPSPNKGNHFHKSPEGIERSRQAHLGAKRSDETKRKISESLKGRVPTKGNKGMHWFTDGVNNIQAYECPEGYRNGRVIPR